MEAATKRFEENQSDDAMHYVMEMPSMEDGSCSGYALDASRKGNISRLINHSCAPNAETQKWLVAGEMRIGIFAKRFIPAGREITYVSHETAAATQTRTPHRLKSTLRLLGAGLLFRPPGRQAPALSVRCRAMPRLPWCHHSARPLDVRQVRQGGRRGELTAV